MAVRSGILPTNHSEVTMARNNFQYEKRQRELEKKRKAEEKAKRKLDAKQAPADGGDGQAGVTGDGGDGGDAVPEDAQANSAAAPPSIA